MNQIGLIIAICICLLFLMGNGSILYSIFLDKDTNHSPVKKPEAKNKKDNKEPIVSDEPPSVPTNELNNNDFDIGDYVIDEDLLEDDFVPP